MKTLNQLKNILIEFFEGHAMINSVYYSDDFDFNAERSIDYPTTNIEYINSRVSDNVTNHNFRITIGDICKPDDTEMEDNIHSDALQISEDFFSYLQNYEGFNWVKNVSITKFTDDTADRIAGITYQITLEVVRPQNRCWSPQR